MIVASKPPDPGSDTWSASNSPHGSHLFLIPGGAPTVVPLTTSLAIHEDTLKLLNCQCTLNRALTCVALLLSIMT